MSRWFRFYDDAINDPKILRLSDANFRAWVTLLCLASKNDGVLPSTNDIALVLRMKPAKVAEWLAMLTAAGLVDNDNGLFRPHNWDQRQFKSDVSNERVKRHRERQRNGDRNVTSGVTVTTPETEQKQITEQNSSLRSEGARKRGARLSEDWTPDAADWREATEKLGPEASVFELSKFRDHWKAQPGQRGVKLDWNATFRNWIRNARGAQNHGNRTGNPRASGHDAILAVASRKARELDRNDEMARPAGAPGFAFGDGSDAAGPRGSRGPAEADRGNCQRQEPDDGRVREGEIIPPDQDAAGFPRGRQFV